MSLCGGRSQEKNDVCEKKSNKMYKRGLERDHRQGQWFAWQTARTRGCLEKNDKNSDKGGDPERGRGAAILAVTIIERGAEFSSNIAKSPTGTSVEEGNPEKGIDYRKGSGIRRGRKCVP